MASNQYVSDLTFNVQKRRRPDRHPYQVAVQVGLICVAASQLIVGLPEQSALYQHASPSLLIALNATLIIGSVLSLVGAFLHRDHDPRLSLRLGIAGQFSIFSGTGAYAVIVILFTEPPYWLSVLSVGLTIGLAYAALSRIFQQWRALRDLAVMVELLNPRKRRS